MLKLKLLVLAASLTSAFWGGWAVANWRTKALAADVATEIRSAENTQQASVDSLALEIAERDAVRHQVKKSFYKEVTHETDKPIYRSCTINDSGVQLYNRAAQNFTSAASIGQGALPRP